MWHEHWGLARDPFDEDNTPYVPLPSHDEALLRLVYSIEQRRRDVVFTAEAGLGKSTVLRQALAQSRSPGRRVLQFEAPSDLGQLIGRLALRLGQSVGRAAGSSSKWSALERAFQVAALEGSHLVLALDNWTRDCETRLLRDLHALAHGGSGRGTGLTVIRIGCPLWDGALASREGRALTIGLTRLTRSQVDEYLGLKLSAAGCSERIFTPRALTRLHGVSRGVPRDLEQLAVLSLMAGAVRGVEVIPPDIVDDVAQEGSLDGSRLKPWP